MNRALAAAGIIMCAFSQCALATGSEAATYPQKTLLKNWALSRCLGQVYGHGKAAQDANASASAYLEFGRQPLETYDAITVVIHKYAHRRYAGSIHSDFNTMKCIDLFHSKELDELTSKLSASRRGVK